METKAKDLSPEQVEDIILKSLKKAGCMDASAGLTARLRARVAINIAVNPELTYNDMIDMVVNDIHMLIKFPDYE